MKAYGKTRNLCANRNAKGTSRPCPCCIPHKGFRSGKNLKKKARQAAKKELREEG
jgi:hypothetical protein